MKQETKQLAVVWFIVATAAIFGVLATRERLPAVDGVKPATSLEVSHYTLERVDRACCIEAPHTARDVLAAYLYYAATEWTPIRHHAKAGENELSAMLRISAFTEAIALVCLDPDEPPFTYAKTRSMTALVMLAQADIEGSLAAWVEDGRCNDAAWRRSQEALPLTDPRRIMKGSCDLGIAWTSFQMHVNDQGGVVLDEGGGWTWGAEYVRTNPEPRLATIIVGRDLVGHPELAARVAHAWMYETPNAWGSHWGSRMKAAAYAAKHPFPKEVP